MKEDFLKPYLEHEKWTVDDLYDLYVTKNFCMDLVSEVTGIPLAPLSRIFQKYGLPDKKRAHYHGQVKYEITKLSTVRTGAMFGKTRSQKALEDDFLDSVPEPQWGQDS